MNSFARFFPGWLYGCAACVGALGAAVPGVRGADYFPPPDSAGGWRTLKEAADIRARAGMELSRLEKAFDLTQRSTQNGGLLVVRHGYLVFEKYFGRAHR